MTETASIFAGVNEGYQGENSAITDPARAVDIVRKHIREIAAASGDKNIYAVSPGVAVYSVARGCPKGGEAVAAITTGGNPGDMLRTAAALRTRLRQTTLSVVTYAGNYGEKTREFTASVARNIRDAGAAWQAAAENCNARHGVHVSCGMVDTGRGTTLIRAAANPANVKDIAQWENVAYEVAHMAGKQLDVPVNLVFRDAGFTYLRNPPQTAATLSN